VSVVFGFTRDLLDVLENRKPDYLFCGMDAAGPTFRHERFEAYKANRAEMPADLVSQIPLVRRLLENSSNDSFLRAGFVKHVAAEQLLAPPQPPPRPPQPHPRAPRPRRHPPRPRDRGPFPH
jgi:hypothetical protein